MITGQRLSGDGHALLRATLDLTRPVPQVLYVLAPSDVDQIVSVLEHQAETALARAAGERKRRVREWHQTRARAWSARAAVLVSLTSAPRH